MHTKCWLRSSCIPKQFPNTPPSQFYLNAAFPGPGCSLLPAQAPGKEELLPFPPELAPAWQELQRARDLPRSAGAGNGSFN